MNGKDIELSRRRVLFTIVVIGLASAAAGAGTMALFSDTETSANNNVTAGTLNLEAGEDSTYGFNITDLEPNGSQHSTDVALANTGNINGTLNMNVSVNDSNGATPESEPSDSLNNISTKIEVNVSYGEDDISDQFGDGQGPLLLSELAGSEVTLDSNLAGQESNVLEFSYSLQDVGNDYQGDKSEIDLTFTLEQN